MELRKRPRWRISMIIIMVVALTLLCVYFLLNAMIRPGLLLYAETRIQAIATDAIYEAIYTHMSNSEESYVDILQTNGEVQYIEMNNRALNKLASLISADVQNYINKIGVQGIDIPYGTASGIPQLAGYGPKMHMTFRPEGTSQVDFSSEFRSAGINQTMHRVHMVVRTDIAMVLPGMTQNISTKVDMTVAEHIVIGKVPNAYAGGSAGGILNLTP